MKTILTVILVMAGTLVPLANGADYYVSSTRSGRSDANAGTDPKAPWATFGKVISVWNNLSAGDTVHLERGSQWNVTFSSDYFNISKGGSSSGGPITLRGDDYGTGNKPILKRTGGSGPNAFIVIRRSYITVRDIELDGGHYDYGQNTTGMVIPADGVDISNLQILNMKIHNLGGSTTAYICGIWLASPTGYTTSDCLIEGNEVSDYSAHGLNHYGHGLKINIIWRNNYVHNDFAGGRYPNANAAIQINSGSSGCVFEHNWLEDTTSENGNLFVIGKHLSDTGFNSIRFNVMANASRYGGIFSFNHTDMKLLYNVYGNIFMNNGLSGLGVFPQNTYAVGTKLNMYNNTFYNNSTAGDATRSEVDIHFKCNNTAIDFANNLMVHKNTANAGFQIYSGFTGTFSHRNNLYWHTGGTSRNIINAYGKLYTVANARNFEASAQNEDPLLLDTAQLPTSVSYDAGPQPGGLALQSGSPAIGAGADLGSTYALDILRAVRTAPWSIGAYELSGAALPADTQSPSVSLTAPNNGATVYGSSVTVSADASDDVGVAGVQFTLNGVNINSEDTTSPYSIVWDSTTASNGTYTLSAVARDAAGNSTAATGITVTVGNVEIPANAMISDTSTWQNQTFTAQSGQFEVQFDSVPGGDAIDCVTGIAQGPAAAYDDLAAMVRFNPSGAIDVRNGDVYTADASINYSAASTYHFRMQIDIAAHIYTVYVQVDGGKEVLIADQYAFRTSQNAVTSLDTLAATGPESIFNFTVKPVVSTALPADTQSPSVSLTAPGSGATVYGSSVTVSADASDDVGVAGVQFTLNGVNLNSEDTTSPYSTVWDSTTVSNGTYTLSAVARDAAGNSTTATGVTVTVGNVAIPADAMISDTNTWQNQSFAAQTGQFEVEFDAVPGGDAIDCVTGIAQGPAAAYDDLAAMVRFNPSGAIDVRNGDVYTAVTPISYVAGSTYHFRMQIDLAAHIYTVYVQVNGGTEVLIAAQYAFRTSQNAVTSLDTLAATGPESVFNFTVKAVVGIPLPPTGLRIRVN